MPDKTPHPRRNKPLVAYAKKMYMHATEGKHTYPTRVICSNIKKKFDVDVEKSSINRWAKGKRPDTGLSWKEQFELAVQKGLGLKPDKEMDSLREQLIRQIDEEYTQLLRSQSVGDELQELILSTTLDAFKKYLIENKDKPDFDPVKLLKKCLPEKITKLLPHIMLNITNRVQSYRDLVLDDDSRTDKSSQDIKQSVQEIRSLM